MLTKKEKEKSYFMHLKDKKSFKKIHLKFETITTPSPLTWLSVLIEKAVMSSSPPSRIPNQLYSHMMLPACSAKFKIKNRETKGLI